MKLKPLLISVVSLTILAACAYRPVPAEKLAGIRSVGVASVCGRTITRESIALLVFGNEVTKGDISSWKMDDTIIDTVKSALEPQISVSTVDVDFERIGVLQPDPLVSSGPPLTDRLRLAIRKPDAPVDAYLLIGATSNGQGVDTMYGFGIFSHGHGQAAHANCALDLIDAKTYQWIAHGWTLGVAGVPSSLRLDRWELYDESQRQKLRDVFTGLIKKNVPKDLAKMNLAQSTPP